MPGGAQYFEYVNPKDYVRVIMSTPMSRDINETIYDFDEKHLAEAADFDLELLSFFHEMAFQMLDEHVFESIDRAVDLEDYEFKEIYFHTNALVLKRRGRER